MRALAAQLREIWCGGEILAADLADDASLQTVCDRAALGPFCDLVINNVGHANRAMIKDIELAELVAMLRVNIEAAVAVAVAAMKCMSDEGRGAIVNIASGTVFIRMPGNAGYGSSKSFITSFPRHMQTEAAQTDVQVQLLLPGIVATEFHDVAGAELSNHPPELAKA